MTDALINKGIATIGRAVEPNKPIVVIGTARGGTSMIAGALAHLGLHMGDHAHPPVFEDIKLSEVMESGDIESAKMIAKEYTEKYGKWGWKRPSSIDRLNETDTALSSPKYIFIYKDIFSIAQRNSISMLSELLPEMERALTQYKKTIDFIRNKNPGALLISYDKALSNSKNLIEKLIDFCELTPSEEQINSAIKFVRPDPKDYLDASRITKAQGVLDGMENGVIFGWARFIHRNTPATVEIYVNEQLVGSAIARDPRKDLTEKFNQECAFNFRIPNDIKIKPGDSIRAKVNHEVDDLKNSPLTAK